MLVEDRSQRRASGPSFAAVWSSGSGPLSMHELLPLLRSKMVRMTRWDMTMARGKRETVSSCAFFLEGPAPHWLVLGNMAISKPLADKQGLGLHQVAH